jgi:hypothetical protein
MDSSRTIVRSFRRLRPTARSVPTSRVRSMTDNASVLTMPSTAMTIARPSSVRPADKGSRAGYPLLLPAGELVGLVIESVTKTDGVDHHVVPLSVRPTTRDRQRQQDVLLRCQRRHQVERLEDKADPIAT